MTQSADMAGSPWSWDDGARVPTREPLRIRGGRPSLAGHLSDLQRGPVQGRVARGGLDPKEAPVFRGKNLEAHGDRPSPAKERESVLT